MTELVHAEDPPSIGSRSDHPLSTRHEVPVSAFTAVNGAAHRNDSSHQSESTKIPVTSLSNGSSRPSLSVGSYREDRHYSPGWRPEQHFPEPSRDSYYSAASNLNGKKRKRNESDGHARETDDQSSRSPLSPNDSHDRRYERMDLESRMISPQPSEHSRIRGRGRDSEPRRVPSRDVREPSPVLRKNAGEPPPGPRPDTAATLAESLQPKTESPRTRTGSHPVSNTSTDSPPSQNGVIEVDDTDLADQSHAEGGLGTDKKRKRVFANRTKTGCHTCRSRKKKCDEAKPTCMNCQRGSFVCSGYGAKPPPGARIQHQHKAIVPIQAKQQQQQQHQQQYDLAPSSTAAYETSLRGSPPTHYPTPHWTERRTSIDPRTSTHPYSQASTIDHRPTSRDQWSAGHWPPPSDPSQSYSSDRLPSNGYGSGPGTLTKYGSDQHSHPDPWNRTPSQISSYRPRGGPGTGINGYDSTSSSSSSKPRPYTSLVPGPNGAMSEKMKMLIGQPYKHYMDDELIRDARQCRQALEEYNSAGRGRVSVGMHEKQRLFSQILDPGAREFSDRRAEYRGPQGTCGTRTIVETPLNCEFGYNIHLGDDVVLTHSCVLQDANEIRIGARVIVGAGVQFYTMTASHDPTCRAGSQGTFLAGAIRVEDDVMIEAGAIIMPYRTIGKGAIVGAGSVVTRDVKPYTMVAGNPAKFLRQIEPGASVERHRDPDPDIQEQNELMLQRMRDTWNRVAPWQRRD